MDWDRCLRRPSREIDAAGIWTGQQQRDQHLRSADFFDVDNHPKITFAGHFTERTGGTTFKGEVSSQSAGSREPFRSTSPRWGMEDAVLGRRGEQGDMRRLGFEAHATINRHDFGVSWQDELPGGGVVVSNQIELVLDVEAILCFSLLSLCMLCGLVFKFLLFCEAFKVPSNTGHELFRIVQSLRLNKLNV